MFDWFLNKPMDVAQKRCTMFAVAIILEIEAQAMAMMKIKEVATGGVL